MINFTKFYEILRQKGFTEEQRFIIHDALVDSEEPSYSPD